MDTLGSIKQAIATSSKPVSPSVQAIVNNSKLANDKNNGSNVSAKTVATKPATVSAPTYVPNVDTSSLAIPVSYNVPSFNDVVSQAKSIATENNAQAQAMAEKQWQFNAEEAQKNRDWQEYMSNTAHQREMQDLLAAGLNPILTTNAGASVGSGATASGSSASPDTSMNSVLGSYFSSLINSATAINQANINAKTNLAIANINRDSAITSAGIGSSAQQYSAELNRLNAILNAETQEKVAGKYSGATVAGASLGSLLRLLPLLFGVPTSGVAGAVTSTYLPY